MKNYNNFVQDLLLNFSGKIRLQNKPRISPKKMILYAFSRFHASPQEIAQNRIKINAITSALKWY